jgi:hypothetical protein
MATDVIDEAMARFRLSRDAFQDQRNREQVDLEFQVPDLQWDSAARRQRQSATINGVDVPPRPTLSISKLEQPIQLILNQQKSAHLGVNVHPVSAEADRDTADMLRGLYRSIERDSRANIARGWAFDRAVKAGMGFYRVNTIYDDESENPFDQKIVIERLLYQDGVYLDPTAQMPDWSDGEFAFCCSWIPFDRYKREYSSSTLANYDGDALEALVGDIPDWVRLDGAEKNAVLVAEYFRKSYRERTWVEYNDGTFGFEDEIPEGMQALAGGRRRTTQIPTVEWSVINGIEEISPTQEWNGKYIPIIPVIGKELQPFDADRYFVGMIGPAKDGQRLYNYAASNAVEIGALEPRAPWLMYEGQDEGYESMWNQANTRNFPTLKVKPTTISGQPAPLPQRVAIDGSRLSVSMQLLAQADQYIQATTAIFDPSLGRGTSDRSGRAVMALQQQSDAGTSNYLDNLAQISMTYEAKVVLDLIPTVYDRPGRVVQVVNGEDDVSTVAVNAPFTFEPQTRRPMLWQGEMPMGDPMMGMPGPGAGAPQGMLPGMLPGMPSQKVQHFDLRKGVYGVAVSVGRSFQTRLDQGAAEMGEILQSNPGLMPLLGPLYFRYRDFPGSQEISELLKKERQHMMPWLDQDQGDDIQQMSAKIQELENQGQQLVEELTKATEYIKTDQAKWTAQADIAKQKADVQLHLQSMRDATSIEVEKIRAMTKGLVTQEKGVQDQMELAMKQRHAREMSAEHILSGQHTQALKEQHEKELEAIRVEGDIAHDAASAEIDVAKDAAKEDTPRIKVDAQVTPDLHIDVDAPLDR